MPSDLRDRSNKRFCVHTVHLFSTSPEILEAHYEFMHADG